MLVGKRNGLALRAAAACRMLAGSPRQPLVHYLHQPAQHYCVAVGYQRIDALPGFELMHAVGKLAHTAVKHVELFVALVQTTLQIKDANDAGQVDAFIGKLVDELQALDETVAQVYQKGYRMGNKVLRAAMVTVTVGGPKRETKSEEDE